MLRPAERTNGVLMRRDGRISTSFLTLSQTWAGIGLSCHARSLSFLLFDCATHASPTPTAGRRGGVCRCCQGWPALQRPPAGLAFKFPAEMGGLSSDVI